MAASSSTMATSRFMEGLRLQAERGSLKRGGAVPLCATIHQQRGTFVPPQHAPAPGAMSHVLLTEPDHPLRAAAAPVDVERRDARALPGGGRARGTRHRLAPGRTPG